jgi:hypothetical protein
LDPDGIAFFGVGNGFLNRRVIGTAILSDGDGGDEGGFIYLRGWDIHDDGVAGSPPAFDVFGTSGWVQRQGVAQQELSAF